MTISPQRISILKRLANGPVPLSEWRKFDQRFVRAMFLRQWVAINRRLDLEITDAGWNLHSDIIRGQIQFRQDPARDTFIESSDRAGRPYLAARHTSRLHKRG